MSKKPKLELSLIEKVEDAPQALLLRVEFPEDPQRDDSPLCSREAILTICSHLRCGCSNVLFHWDSKKERSQKHSSLPPRAFWFSINKNEVDLPPEQENDPELLRLGEILTEELNEEMRIQIRTWILATKVDLIQTTPVDEFGIENLPDASDGAMIGFTDVFPCGFALHLSWNNEVWGVDEQYCVQSRCPCNEMFLTFLKLKDTEGNKVTVIRDSPALYYNYGTEATQVFARGETEDPPLDGLLEALKGQYTDLNSQLKLRHGIMQSLYLRQESEQKTSRRNTLLTTSPKIGRNDPCLCNSGRKYKHCCWNKPRA